MATHTIIYGHIQGWDTSWGGIDTPNQLHNEKMIQELPLGDAWPPVSREMFGITKNVVFPGKGPMFDFFGVRVIHFGASLKGVEYEWDEWMVKFESLLDKLFWIEASVHMCPEWTSTQHCTWSVDLLKWTDQSKPAPRSSWACKDEIPRL